MAASHAMSQPSLHASMASMPPVGQKHTSHVACIGIRLSPRCMPMRADVCHVRPTQGLVARQGAAGSTRPLREAGDSEGRGAAALEGPPLPPLPLHLWPLAARGPIGA